MASGDELARNYAEGIAESVREVEVSGWEVREAWASDVLDWEIVWSSGREVVGVRLLITAGGPTCWVCFDGDGADVVVSWACEPVHVYVECPVLSSQVLDRYGEGLAWSDGAA